MRPRVMGRGMWRWCAAGGEAGGGVLPASPRRGHARGQRVAEGGME